MDQQWRLLEIRPTKHIGCNFLNLLKNKNKPVGGDYK
jgi:hypothetical protein